MSMLTSPYSSTFTPAAMLASPTHTTQERRDDEIDQNPPPAYGAFAFHLAGDTQASHPVSTLSESFPSMPLEPPSPFLSPLTTRGGISGSSPEAHSLPTAPISPLLPLSPVLAAESAPRMPPTDPSQHSHSEQFLIEIDQDLAKVNSLLSEISVLTAEQESSSSLPSRTPLATFRELDALELYHSNPQKCLSGLAKERQRLLKARQALRVQWIGIQAQTGNGLSTVQYSEKNLENSFVHYPFGQTDNAKATSRPPPTPPWRQRQWRVLDLIRLSVIALDPMTTRLDRFLRHRWQ